MRIEEVEALADKFLDEEIFQDRYYAAEFLWSGFEQTIEALRSEAWYPIERAEEMGVKDGREIVAYGSYKGGGRVMKEKMIYMTESEFKQLMRESLRDAGIDKIVLENELLKVENAQLKKQLESK
jgi:hypothetical protein